MQVVSVCLGCSDFAFAVNTPEQSAILCTSLFFFGQTQFWSILPKVQTVTAAKRTCATLCCYIIRYGATYYFPRML